MTWRYPKHPLTSGQVVSPEEVNEAFRPAAEELSGRLNEHNWAENAVSQHVNIDASGPFVWHSDGIYSDVDQGGGSGHSPGTNINFVQFDLGWNAVDDLLIEVSSPRTLLWIHVSLQVETRATTPANAGQIFLAIEVDGQLVQESVIGGGDPDDDLGESGYSPLAIPYATSLVLPVTAGEHKIRAMARTVDGFGPLGSYYIESREIIVLEMRR